MTLGPPVPSSGPRNARIALVGEAPGDEESERLKPFIGPSGQELRRMLRTLGVSIEDCYVTNVFSQQPQGNDLSHFGTSNRHGAGGVFGPLTLSPQLWVDDQHLHHIERLHHDLAEVSPNITILLGTTACWAMGLGQGVKALRGSVSTIDLPGATHPLKLLGTYHPAAVLRQWDLRVICIADLQKAINESSYPELIHDNATLYLHPTLDDLEWFGREHLEKATILSCDIECERGRPRQITCVSFAPSPEHCLVVPFWLYGEQPNYWKTVEEEREAWKWMRYWLEKPDLPKLFQNGLFDVQYLQKFCQPRNLTEDTMLLSHSLFSELPKDLGFLGSIYTNFQSWKRLRTFSKADLYKRDD